MKEDTRKKIINTATILFHTQGYRATGINEIINKSGIAKSTLYNHFKSKEELAVAYLNERHQSWMSDLKAFIEDENSNKEKIVRCFDFIDYLNQKEDYKGCCFLNMLGETNIEDLQIRKQIIEHKKDLKLLFASLAADNQSTIADHIYLLFESALIETQLYRSQWPTETVKKIIKTYNI